MKITYMYHTSDVFDHRSEDFVISSIRSMSGLPEDSEVMIVNYGEDEKLKGVAKEWDIDYYSIEKEEDVIIEDVAKMTNFGIYKAKGDFFTRLTIDTVYPEAFDRVNKLFIERMDTDKYCLVNPYFKIPQTLDSIPFNYSPIILHKTEYLRKARGIDERICFYCGEHKYLRDITLKLFGFEPIINETLRFIHRPHKTDYRNGIDHKKLYEEGVEWVKKRIEALKMDFNKEVKNVVNSYW